jgi:hypothetical protein
MWTYNQSNGQLRKDDILVGSGYSGKDDGKNNPALESRPDVGPIPQGEWEICGPPYDTSQHGPYVLRLEPRPGTVVFGRAGFLIHGDSIPDPGQASEGCIVMNRMVRTRIWQSGDYRLTVISGKAGPDFDGEISV